jgi:hypothetical protein
MAMVDALLPEFDHEMTTTRKLLERVPDDRLAWKPHAKSMTLGGLATHLSNIPWWGQMTVTQFEFDLASSPPPAEATSRAQFLETFDRNVAAAGAGRAGHKHADELAASALYHRRHPIFFNDNEAVLRYV